MEHWDRGKFYIELEILSKSHVIAQNGGWEENVNIIRFFTKTTKNKHECVWNIESWVCIQCIINCLCKATFEKLTVLWYACLIDVHKQIKDDLDVCTCLHASCIMVVINFLNRLKTFTSRDSSNETTTHDSKTSFNLDAGADLLQRYKLICSLNPLFFLSFPHVHELDDCNYWCPFQ